MINPGSNLNMFMLLPISYSRWSGRRFQTRLHRRDPDEGPLIQDKKWLEDEQKGDNQGIERQGFDEGHPDEHSSS
jgi:hypothetical protein